MKQGKKCRLKCEAEIHQSKGYEKRGGKVGKGGWGGEGDEEVC